MKAIVITQPGGPEVLQMQERPIPACAANEVLVKVAAAGINRPDVSQRKGNYPPPPGASPDIPGLEIAGTVVETGAGVNRWKVGDKICALVTLDHSGEICLWDRPEHASARLHMPTHGDDKIYSQKLLDLCWYF